MRLSHWLRPANAPRPAARSAPPPRRLRFDLLEDRSVPSATIDEFGGTGNHPDYIQKGPDGNLWFNTPGQPGSALGRITPAGQVTEVPTPDGYGHSFAFGTDGNIWLGGTTSIAEITPQGVLLHQYDIPSTQHVQYSALSVTLGADGNIWYTEYWPNQDGSDVVGRLTPDGAITEFAVPAAAAEIVTGKDGNVWFDFTTLHALGRITPTGVVTVFSNLDNGTSSYRGLMVDHSGNLWLSCQAIGGITEVSQTGQTLATYTDPDAPYLMAEGPDGNIWYTEVGGSFSADGGNRIGRITPQGEITKYAIPTANAGATGITAGPDGNIWFAEYNANQIGEVVLNQPPTASAGGPYTTTYGSGVTLDGSGSSDPDGDPLTYSWTINGQSAATGVHPTLTWDQLAALGVTTGGPFDVRVTVSDGVNPPVTSQSTSLTVAKATPTVTVAGGSFVYDGQAHPATGSVAGPNGENLGTPTFTYYYQDADGNWQLTGNNGADAPVDPGYYKAVASFAGDDNFLPASATASITIAYEAQTLTDLSKAFHAGRAIPIKVQLTDASGSNLSAPDVTVTAMSLWQVNADGTRTQVALQDAGGSNPDNVFRYDAALGGYIFNLSTKGLTAGDYAFDWTAEGDPTTHELGFDLV